MIVQTHYSINTYSHLFVLALYSSVFVRMEEDLILWYCSIIKLTFLSLLAINETEQ